MSDPGLRDAESDESTDFDVDIPVAPGQERHPSQELLSTLGVIGGGDTAYSHVVAIAQSFHARGTTARLVPIVVQH